MNEYSDTPWATFFFQICIVIFFMFFFDSRKDIPGHGKWDGVFFDMISFLTDSNVI